MATVNPYADSNAAIARDTSDLQGNTSWCTEYRGHFDYTLNGSNNDEYYANYVRFGISNITYGATINHAYMYFTVSAKSTGTCYVRVYAEDTADAYLPNNLDDFTSGGRTSAYKEYNFSNLTNGDTYYLDLTDIVQEIINKGGWTAGNHINIEMAEYQADLNAYTDFKTSDCHLDIDYTNSVTLPSVTTESNDPSSTSAVLYGNVTDDGGEYPDRYMEWGTSTSYGDSCDAGSGGTGSYNCSATGLTANTTYHYRAKVHNSAGWAYGDDKTFTTLPNPPTVTTGDHSEGDTYATLYGNVTDTGGENPERHIAWGTSTDYSNDCNAGTGGTGSYSCYIDGLSPNTTYHYQAWASNSGGDGNGADATFTTAPSVTLPTVTTDSVVEIRKLTAIGNGTITDDGGDTTTRGICWNTSGTPTTSDSHDTNGTGEGSYGIYMTGLSKDQVYYIRAYGTNSAGTSYGDQLSFRTDYATLKRYDSSSWVTAPLKTYNGSSWIDKPLKIYEGSWKDVETL